MYARVFCQKNLELQYKKIIENNRKLAKESSKIWSEESVQKTVEIKANDNITLRGTEYLQDQQIDKWVIILHGYRASTKSVLPIGEQFSKKGYIFRLSYWLFRSLVQ